MKRCPTCQKTYTDANLSYCIDDGTPLVTDTADDDTTVVSPQQSSAIPSPDPQDSNSVAYRPPSAYVQPTAPKRRVWPWVVGLLSLLILVVVGLGIAAAILAPSIMRRSANRNDSPVVITPSSNRNAPRVENTNSDNANANTSNTNADGSANANTNAPTDKEQVLAQLSDLEHEWTVANINADKKKLDMILADDYVGPAADGQMQGKREYIRDIQRDTSIQKWDFRNLKLTLRGDRATLAGQVVLTINNRDVVYDFVDKFVWRDGRWQATGSVVTPA